MLNPLPYKPKSLLFAPMEGVTDGPYRRALHKSFPEWDRYFTDFLRVPTTGRITPRIVREHIGESVLTSPNELKKTSYQILTSDRAQTESVIEQLNEMPIDHLDLNLGCPSKKVNSHGGGAYLLSDLEQLSSVVRKVRTNFNKCFTVKIRLGYRDESLYFDILKLLEDEGVDAITIHGRTRDDLYRGRARWEPIRQAVERCRVPIIGNGDIWDLSDIQKMFDECGCHSVMIARGALKTPWLATLAKEYKGRFSTLDKDTLLQMRQGYLELYFLNLEKEYIKAGYEESAILQRFKAMSRYLFDDYPKAEEIRSLFLRSHSLAEFQDSLFLRLPKEFRAYATL